MVNLDSATVEVHLETPLGEVPVGRFVVAAGEVRGTDMRGIEYRGTCSPSGTDVHIALSISIPAGVPIARGQVTAASVDHEINFDLDPQHIAGQKTKTIHLPGFGDAEVRFKMI